ncbi:hypothetical protein [Phenylobacterium sp.]|nr:hypothetical protein [Phenylobacterium sp.]
MSRIRMLSRIGLICFGGAKRLTKGQPEGERIEPLGDFYDVG